MSTKKKLIIAITAVSIALVITLVTLIVVIVASTQLAESNVVVEYVATDVAATVSANYIIGDDEPIALTTDGTDEGSDSISFYPGKNSIGTLCTNNEITLTAANPELIFEYKFINNSSNVDINFALTAEVDTDVVDIKFGYSSEKITNFSSLATVTSYTTQTLLGNANKDATKYVYIILTIKSGKLSTDFESTGNFSWVLTRTEINN